MALVTETAQNDYFYKKSDCQLFFQLLSGLSRNVSFHQEC